VHKAVIDTNVVISSFFSGKPRDVMNLWRDGKLLLCLSDDILAEYLEVLARFESLTASEARDLLDLFGDPERAIFVAPRESIQEVVADPTDNIFLDCAAPAGAHAIISGDERLLSLKQFREIPIVSPSDFLASAGDM
jgi:hypothetical protein